MIRRLGEMFTPSLDFQNPPLCPGSPAAPLLLSQGLRPVPPARFGLFVPEAKNWQASCLLFGPLDRHVGTLGARWETMEAACKSHLGPNRHHRFGGRFFRRSLQFDDFGVDFNSILKASGTVFRCSGIIFVACGFYVVGMFLGPPNRKPGKTDSIYIASGLS